MMLAKRVFLAHRFFNTKSKRTLTSALYITGDKAHETFAALKPIVDFEERLQDRLLLEQNLKLRKLDVDLKRLERRWNFYKHLDEQRKLLEVIKTEIGHEIVRLKDGGRGSNDKDIEKLMLHGKLVKDDLKVLRDYLYGVEESAVLDVLALPNSLHNKTPNESEVVIYSYLEKPNGKSNCHLDIGKENNLITYLNALNYFLQGDAALFELSVCEYISSALLNLSFTQFSNADFSRSVIVEGCGTDFLDKFQTFTLEEVHNDDQNECSRLHLTGGASLYSFMAYFARNSIQLSYLPLKIFAAGRKYQPTTKNVASDHGLFNISQESAVEVFIATVDNGEELENELQKLVTEIIAIYEPLGYHFRLVYLPASELKNYESLRLSIQMFSNYLQQYIEVGHLSVCDSYLSKRLLFTYSVNKEWKFPKILSGSLLRVQPLLACILENGSLKSAKNMIPSVLNGFIFGNKD